MIAHKSALVLALTDFNPSFSLYRPKSSAASTTGSTSGDGSMRDLFETVDIEHVTNYTFKVDFAGIGISVVNKRVQASQKRPFYRPELHRGMNLTFPIFLGNGLCYYERPQYQLRGLESLPINPCKYTVAPGKAVSIFGSR